MNKGDEISIKQVNNRYIVMPTKYSPSTMVPNSEIYIFQSFRELNIWLADHFTYINKTLLSNV